MLLTTPSVAAQADYLQALEAEVTKIPVPLTGEGAAGEAETRVNNVDSTADRNRFEAVLRDRYRGTYVFYRELPENIRAEFVGEFRSGVPVTDLREKIVDRYLQR